MSAPDSTLSLQQVARGAARLFEKASRPGGERFTRLREGAPDWVREAVRDAHGSDAFSRMLPDDHTYAVVAECFEYIAETLEREIDPSDINFEDVEHEFADNVDVYSSDLLAWYGSHTQRKALVEEAQQEGLTASDTDSQEIERQIMAGQYLERQRIYAAVVEAIKDQADKGDEVQG